MYRLCEGHFRVWAIADFVSQFVILSLPNSKTYSYEQIVQLAPENDLIARKKNFFLVIPKKPTEIETIKKEPQQQAMTRMDRIKVPKHQHYKSIR